MSKLCWRPVKDGVIDAESLYRPGKRHKPIDLLIDFDLFDQTDAIIDVVLAVVASTAHTRFFYETAQTRKRAAYLGRLAKRGRLAAKDYEQQMRAHFAKHSHAFIEGHTLPEPPTPELRAIYDSAAAWEKRSTKPLGHGWSLGEYHWRKWPLSNLIDDNDLSLAK